MVNRKAWRPLTQVVTVAAAGWGGWMLSSWTTELLEPRSAGSTPTVAGGEVAATIAALAWAVVFLVWGLRLDAGRRDRRLAAGLGAIAGAITGGAWYGALPWLLLGAWCLSMYAGTSTARRAGIMVVGFACTMVLLPVSDVYTPAYALTATLVFLALPAIAWLAAARAHAAPAWGLSAMGSIVLTVALADAAEGFTEWPAIALSATVVIVAVWTARARRPPTTRPEPASRPTTLPP